MIKLTKQELINITNKARVLLYNADINENNILVFEEVGGDVKPVLLTGSKMNGKCGLFPRGENPNCIFMRICPYYIWYG